MGTWLGYKTEDGQKLSASGVQFGEKEEWYTYITKGQDNLAWHKIIEAIVLKLA